ncbi:MAG: GSCFA domain-containing protein [Muribaculaceae bacterium]|nr:GSCFA domain-containing protein [Muribaculaceae bacterium]
MNFRTEYKTSESPLRLSAHRNLLFFGSCFSENICRKMRESLWPAVNPAGVLYNPASIATILDRILEERDVREDWIARYDGVYHNMLLDSGFSSVSVKEMNDKYVKTISDCRGKLRLGADIIVTFGTAFVYTLENFDRLISHANHKESNSRRFQYDPEGCNEAGFHRVPQPFIVGNCHKMPSSDFSRRMMSVSEIVGIWNNLIPRLRDKYPSTRIIFTLSPVRHLKDGFEGNSLSKAVVRLAIDEILKDKHPAEFSYFPAYEILHDDLRDYRFYATDLVHPSESAVDYIYDIFQRTYIPEADRNLARRGIELQRGLHHRPIIDNPVAEAERNSKLRSKAEELKKQWPECLLP